MLSREDKQTHIKNVSSALEQSSGRFLIQFKGLSVSQMTELRARLREKKSQVKVVRNTLTLRALKNHPHLEKAFEGDLTGANAFVFSFGEASETAKVLSDFCEDCEFLKLKKGVIGEDVFLEKQIHQLAKLPSKDELRQKLLALLMTPMSSCVRTMNETAGSFVRLLSAKSKT